MVFQSHNRNTISRGIWCCACNVISLISFIACTDSISLLLWKLTMATDQNIQKWNLDAIDCEKPLVYGWYNFLIFHLNYVGSLLLWNLVVVERLLWKTLFKRRTKGFVYCKVISRELRLSTGRNWFFFCLFVLEYLYPS